MKTKEYRAHGILNTKSFPEASLIYNEDNEIHGSWGPGTLKDYFEDGDKLELIVRKVEE